MSVPSFLKRLHRRPKEKLCSMCARLDFRLAFTSSVDENAFSWEFHANGDHLKSNDSCPFCRLILKTILSQGSFKHVRVTPHDFSQPGRLSGEVTLKQRSCGHFLDGAKGAEVYVPAIVMNIYLLKKVGAIQALSDSMGEGRGGGLSTRLLRGRELGQKMDPDVVKEWLRICVDCHTGTCKSGLERIEEMNLEFRLVDVVDRCVVKVSGPSTYAALSYVWGGPDTSQLKLQKCTSARLFIKDGLGHKHRDIPTTIKDAMALCGRLGYRFLWVDSLCIYQDDVEDQAKQFKNMHIIYRNAEFTMVSAFGSNSWSGIPGVSPRAHKQIVETVQGIKLANVLVDYGMAIMDSVWATRAWTMQEAHFSIRAIYFTSHQIYFQCSQALWREDRVIEADPTIKVDEWDSRTPLDDFEGNTYLYKQKSQEHSPLPFDEYCLFVKGYTKRAMTNNRDILNAFAGILADLSPRLGCDFIWGLPVAFLDLALMFKADDGRPILRRTGFPSWSWAGWQETAENYNKIGPCLYYDSFRTSKAENPEEAIRSQDPLVCGEIDWHHVSNGEYVRLENTNVPKAKNSKEDFAIRFARQSWKHPWFETLTLSPLPLGLTADEEKQLLVFQTSCAFLYVDWTSNPKFANVLPADWSQPLITQLCGAINEKYRNTKKMEFIVIASHGPSKFPLENRYKGHLHTMAVETDERGISQRICLASPLDSEEWVKYKPRWRTVFLV